MRPIPRKLRDDMASDMFYKTCCMPMTDCNGRIEWHHNLIFRGRQVNEKFAILPLCQKHHRIADRSDVKNILNAIMSMRASKEELNRFNIKHDRI